MFDRIFNIMRANLNDTFSFGQEKVSKEDWEAYEKFYQQKKQQEEAYNNAQNEFNAANHQKNLEEQAYYKALEVPVGASFDQIKESYKRLIKQYHPDRFANEPDKQKVAMEISQKLNVAYSYFEKKYGK